MKQYLKNIPALSSNSIIILATACILFINNHAFWSTLFQVVDVTGMHHVLFLAAITLLVFSLTFILISIFSFRPVLKPAVFVIIVTSSITGYFMDSFGIVIDASMIQNMMQTDTAEAAELISAALLKHVFLFGLLPAMVITAIPVKYAGWTRSIATRSLVLVTITGLTALSVYFSYKDVSFILRENKQITYMINPAYPLRSLIRYYRDQQPMEETPLQTVFSDAHMADATTETSRPSVFVIVLGETARAHNFHINGYTRNTTPRIEKKHVINFNNTSSCGTSTAVSVPCIFSELEHNNFDSSDARHRENLLDALSHAGIEVLWRDNNSGCKGVCERVATENMHHLHIDDYCDREGCYDEVLLYNLQDYIDNLQHDAVIVLHQQGSHGPSYYKRYPRRFAQFQPECSTPDVQNCSYQEIVNAYDNTILYTDYFLSRVIDLLESRSGSHDTAMLYVSDHGESLGENGIYLHGLPYMLAPEEQTRVPFMIWLSDRFIGDMHIDTTCLEQRKKHHFSHDNILHSMLGVMGVRTQLYNPERDIFAACHSDTRHRSMAHNSKTQDFGQSATL